MKKHYLLYLLLPIGLASIFLFQNCGGKFNAKNSGADKLVGQLGESSVLMTLENSSTGHVNSNNLNGNETFDVSLTAAGGGGAIALEENGTTALKQSQQVNSGEQAFFSTKP